VKNECIYTSSSHICLYVVHRDGFTFFFFFFFPISLFIKCSVVSCVQIMECSNVLVTVQEDGNFHGWTGSGSEISPPVYIWKATQFTGCS
jgi:hypothetical protein